MSSEVEEPGRGYLKVALSLAGLIVTAVAIVFVVGGRATPLPTSAAPTSNSPAKTVSEDESLREARDLLLRESDLPTCRAAIAKINSHLNQHSEQRPPNGGDETFAKLDKHFGLDAGESAELRSDTYTPLDARYLDQCFLLRDAARAIDVDETGSEGKPLRAGPVERATAAFRWVVRQVRPIERSQGPLPPAFTLRRGSGNALERSLVFLALLDQDTGPERLRGCLLTVSGGDKQPPRLWACGVVVGDGKDVYLYDPRLGMPVPGPGGNGVATLAAAAKDPSILAQLNLSPENPYDVKAHQLMSTEGLAVFSLSALAPRMRHLQDTLFNHSLGAQLVADPADVDHLQQAVKGSGGVKASVWNQGIGLLRHFLPPQDGGTDRGMRYALRNLQGFTRPDDPTEVTMTNLKLYEWALVPWETMPQTFNPVDFPITVGLGQRVRELFARPFTQPVVDPHSSRELLIRGRYTQAVPKLVTEDSDLRDHIARRASASDLDQKVQEWLKVARQAYVFQQRAMQSGQPSLQLEAATQIDGLWGLKVASPVYVLIFGASSGPRDGEVTYQLALCMQEQAEQHQARLDLLKRAGIAPAATDVERCKQTWGDANGWWSRFVTDYGQGPAGPPARQNRGRAQAMLGDWEAAAATFGDLSGPMTSSEKLAALYRAREARNHLLPSK